MRREGHQHGVLLLSQRKSSSKKIPVSTATRISNQTDSPLTAGNFTKISNKPTNHSKFIGNCEKVRWSACHLQPKEKCKGTQKVKSSGGAVKYQLKGYQIMSPNKFTNPGYSASDILDDLETDYHRFFYHDDDDNHEGK